MCDYSLHAVRTRPEKVADKLTVRDFGTRTRGFAAPEYLQTAVFLLPGTELAVTDSPRRVRSWPWSRNVILHKAAIFRHINTGNPRAQPWLSC